jgi:hypothetical protein
MERRPCSGQAKQSRGCCAETNMYVMGARVGSGEDRRERDGREALVLLRKAVRQETKREGCAKETRSETGEQKECKCMSDRERLGGYQAMTGEKAKVDQTRLCQAGPGMVMVSGHGHGPRGTQRTE